MCGWRADHCDAATTCGSANSFATSSTRLRRRGSVTTSTGARCLRRVYLAASTTPWWDTMRHWLKMPPTFYGHLACRGGYSSLKWDGLSWEKAKRERKDCLLNYRQRTSKNCENSITTTSNCLDTIHTHISNNTYSQNLPVLQIVPTIDCWYQPLQCWPPVRIGFLAGVHILVLYRWPVLFLVPRFISILVFIHFLRNFL